MTKIVTLSSAIALALTVSTTVAAPNMGNKQVEKFDVNKDGEITKAEVLQVHGESFTTADADGDGFLTLDEMTTAPERLRQEQKEAHFAKLDTNGDGSLSLEEFAGSPPAQHPGKQGGDPEKKLSKLDQDGDGQLSDAETSAPLLKVFKCLDTDGNDVVSKDEMNKKAACFGKSGKNGSQGGGKGKKPPKGKGGGKGKKLPRSG
jgi:Ca2+-binding EF-hand superfamily protein